MEETANLLFFIVIAVYSSVHGIVGFMKGFYVDGMWGVVLGGMFIFVVFFLVLT